MLTQSHSSLRDNYQVSCEEIEYLIENLNQFSSVWGARIMGGGFGGSLIALVEERAVPKILAELSDKYFHRYGIRVEGYQVKPSKGAGYVDS